MSARIHQIDIEDHAALLRYLRAGNWVAADENPVFRTLTGGVSNRTVWVKRGRGNDWVIKQALAKLRVPVAWHSAPERIQREAAGLRWLGKIMPEQAPALVFEDRSNNILAMTAIPQPHINWKSALLKGCADVQRARNFGALLATIHQASERYPELKTEFDERRYFEELRLEPYYGFTATQVPAASGYLRRLISDTRRRRFALVHGDYSPKNVLIYEDRLIILDFEVIHFGDPAFDIGFSLTHFLSKAHHLPANRSALLELAQEYWRSYKQSLRPTLPDGLGGYAVRHTLACLLARVGGRSPLEYLDAIARERQKRIVLELMAEDIGDVSELIDAFGKGLEQSHE
ncbi:MAG: aminoglycoside phosphotransferase family protein [Chloroflexi bacterium]|nr:aminoglycoside phosphotransferase family protein [Chloroflexota bacterium]